MGNDLGDRMKMYEGAEAGRRFMPLLPVLARLDGRNFSTFTKGLARPYDPRLSDLMRDVTTALVKETTANCGYTQSDEITLVWYATDPKSQIYFDGRVMKMTSVLGAVCTAEFNGRLRRRIPEKAHLTPVFDCRCWQVPTPEEAANVFVWREWDAVKNSVTMAAQEHYSHAELMHKTGSEKQEMLFRKGVNFNDYPAFFKRGSYVRRRVVKSKLTPADLESLPPLHNARKNPDMEFERSVTEGVELPPITKVTNRVGVILFGEEPVTTGGQNG